MLLRLFENASMRHEMRHYDRTVSESTRFETSATREKESLIIQTVRNMKSRSSNSSLHRFHRGMYRFGALGEKPHIAWVLRQLGVGSVEELEPKDAFRIQDFSHNRRKYGRNLVEQWEKF